MRHLDADFVEEIIERLGKIPEDGVPAWGELRRDSLMEHLIWAVRHSMGRSGQMPFIGNWFSTHILRRLYLGGLMPTPKNLRFPGHFAAQGITLREHGDLETLHALLEEYLNLVQADELIPAPHPFFGDLGVDGWDRMHVRHFGHHLRQFQV